MVNQQFVSFIVTDSLRYSEVNHKSVIKTSSNNHHIDKQVWVCQSTLTVQFWKNLDNLYHKNSAHKTYPLLTLQNDLNGKTNDSNLL